MAMATSAMCTTTCLLLLMLVAPALGRKSPAGPLWYEFYSSSCPNAEGVIRNVTQEIISEDPTMGAAFIKLFFVDCSIGGCDASILLDPAKMRKKEIYWNLRAIDAINKVKAAVEAICPGIVSCADILALAARDSVTISGGFGFAMPTGRRDGLFAEPNNAGELLPSETSHVQDLINYFAAKGLDVDDLVALSGAHSFGVSHCGFIQDRLYQKLEPAMDADLSAELRRKGCEADTWWMSVDMNQVTNTSKLSNQYYSNVESGKVLFTSDQTLMERDDTAAKVAYYAANSIPWMVRFAGALVKMGAINVLTGTAGEIRKFCNVTSSSS
ncbi:hypothetical protein ACP4OV_010414 [Aristida adscensionis]